MNAERLEEARESLCGWDRCADCQLLREAIAEIERLRKLLGRYQADLARVMIREISGRPSEELPADQ